MPRRTFDTAAVVGAVGAGLLLISVFLDWWDVGLGGRAHGISGWTSFEVLDLVLVALAVLGLLAAADRLGYPGPVGGRGLTVIGGVAVVIVASQLLNHPPVAQGASPEVGAWLALGSAIVVAAAGFAGVARISVEVVVDREPQPDDSPGIEAAAEEPKVERELYPADRGPGPLGTDDPEPFRAGPEDETQRLD